MNKPLAAEHKDYAHQLLKFFVHNSAELYGRNFVIYIMHSLIYLHKVAERYGCLELQSLPEDEGAVHVSA
jgi:hypothetical protein